MPRTESAGFKAEAAKGYNAPITLARLLNIPMSGVTSYALGDAMDLQYKLKVELTSGSALRVPSLSNLRALINGETHKAFTIDDADGTLSGDAVSVTGVMTVSKALSNGWWARWWKKEKATSSVMALSDTPTISELDSQIDETNKSVDGQTNYINARYEGLVYPSYTEAYTFTLRTDDGVRMWIDGALVVDAWKGQSATNYMVTISLTSGVPVWIVIEHYEHEGDERLQLRWSSTHQAAENVGATAGTVKSATSGATGTWESDAVDWGTALIVDTTLLWTQDIPAGCTLTVLGMISMDGGANWETEWKRAFIGGPIPCDMVTNSFYCCDIEKAVTFKNEAGADEVYYPMGLTYEGVEVSRENREESARLKLDNTQRDFAKLARYCKLNGVEVHILQVFRDTLTDAEALLPVFVGKIKNSLIGESMIDLDLRGYSSASRQVPARLFMPVCGYVFKDASTCGYTGGASSCDRKYATCQSLGNDANFPGFPFLPASRDVRDPLT